MTTCRACHACNGSGKCTRCEGGGYLLRGSRGNERLKETWLACPTCGSSGDCPSCEGKGQVERTQSEASPLSN
ncbi:MAG: hypothetical protein IAG10_02535 [Planctomycetaceae bacterium]|nr:hypothetical protein [Planctomycetaceae bacterium]